MMDMNASQVGLIKQEPDIFKYEKYDMETDISQLEAPTFTTIDRSNPASMLALEWDHKVNLVGKKVLNPMIHCCDKCLKPILIYGRMIPCKHVFCLGCAKQEDRSCPRCGDKVVRVEQAGLGNIFLCTIGGSRYGNGGCRRTYLSSRDLQAHITHRHSDKKAAEKSDKSKSADENLRSVVNSISKASLASVVAAVNNAASTYSGPGSYTATPATDSHGMNISVLNSRPSNLITIHSGQEAGGAGQSFPAPGYPPAQTGYQNYGPAASASPAAASYPNLSQPPPTFGYSGGYSGAGGQQYSAPPGPPQYSGQPGYPGGAAVSSYPGSSHAPSPGQAWAAPPPGPGSGQQWTRPPPAQQQTYYRR